jgi:hypothetical protein
MTTAKAAPTGAITLPTQFTRFKTVPSGWAAVCPCTACPVAGQGETSPRFSTVPEIHTAPFLRPRSGEPSRVAGENISPFQISGKPGAAVGRNVRRQEGDSWGTDSIRRKPLFERD